MSSLSPTIGNLWRISYPLMLTALSGNLMMFGDRLILAWYSKDAMNAAAVAGMVCAIVHMGGIGVTAIAEVFVGQYNGAKEWQKIGRPVWQMIWFSLLLFIVSIPLGCFGAPYFLPKNCLNEGAAYFQICMIFSPLPALIAALSSFYIGQGKVRLVTGLVIVSNIFNLGLDILLIQGIQGFIPAYGAGGAAAATVIAQVLQIGGLGAVFLSHKHRARFSTNQWKFDWFLFKEGFFIGFPNSISHMLEIGAWALLLHIVSLSHPDFLVVQTIGSSIYGLSSFITDGLQKGIIAIASNLIGAQRTKDIYLVIKSGVGLHFLFASIFLVPFLVYPHLLINIFFSGEGLSPLEYSNLIVALGWVWAYFLMDGLVWIIAGILTAGSDTRFIMVANAFNAWFFAIVPAYIGLNYFSLPGYGIWIVIVCYGGVNMLTFLWRYYQGHWYKDLAHPTAESPVIQHVLQP